jgi:hypothetical protein
MEPISGQTATRSFWRSWGGALVVSAAIILGTLFVYILYDRSLPRSPLEAYLEASNRFLSRATVVAGLMLVGYWSDFMRKRRKK